MSKKETLHIQDKEEFFTRLYEAFQDGQFEEVSPGKYDGGDFLIVQSWEALASLDAFINGSAGDLNLTVVWDFESLDTELDKAEKKLETVDPTHLGTISRLKTRIEQLRNLSKYRRWLHNNNTEPITLDSLGIETGFSDEYDLCCGRCNGCDTVVRTSPDSYSWTPPLFVDCEGYACDECAVSDFSEYVLEEYCNVAKSIPSQFDTGELGLVKINKDSFQSGSHPGMDDSPEPIIRKMQDAGIDVWFKAHPSQFYYDFDVYVREADKDKAVEVLTKEELTKGIK